MLTNNTTESLPERHHIDPVFKEVMTRNFGQLNLPIQTQVEVSRLPRAMDALVVLKSSDEIEKVRAETAFSYFRAHHHMEYKGKEDLLTLFGYHLIRGRSHLFVGNELEIEPKNYPLLLFASSKQKLRQFFERIVSEDNILYIY